MTLSDLEYRALVQAVGVIITTTGTTTNATQYIRDAITGAVCRDLKLNQLSDLKELRRYEYGHEEDESQAERSQERRP